MRGGDVLLSFAISMPRYGFSGILYRRCRGGAVGGAWADARTRLSDNCWRAFRFPAIILVFCIHGLALKLSRAGGARLLSARRRAVRARNTC